MKNEQKSKSEKTIAAVEFMSKYEGFIKFIILKHTNDPHTADDIFQNFFLSILEKPIPEKIKNVHGYINRAIRNDIIDNSRKNKTIVKHQNKYYETFHKRYNSIPVPEDELIKKETRSKLLQIAKSKLPTYQYKALKLRYIQEYSVPETAVKLNISARSVSRYVSVGLKNLNNIASQGCPEIHECA